MHSNASLTPYDQLFEFQSTAKSWPDLLRSIYFLSHETPLRLVIRNQPIWWISGSEATEFPFLRTCTVYVFAYRCFCSSVILVNVEEWIDFFKTIQDIDFLEKIERIFSYRIRANAEKNVLAPSSWQFRGLKIILRNHTFHSTTSHLVSNNLIHFSRKLVSLSMWQKKNHGRAIN